jgi:serine/threonine-protein phosphatase 4 regulatory subunit 4
MNDFLFIENEYKTSAKVQFEYFNVETEEEVKKFTLEEDLDETRRSFFILTKGLQI